jgi:lipopolysaccharide export system permease protein
MNLLDRYIARTILVHTLMVMGVLLALMTLVTFIGQQDDIGQGSYNVTAAFLVTFLQLPQQAYELLPIGALIGAIIGLGGLARDSELTIVRAAGVSIARIALSAAFAGIVVAGALWVIGEYFAPPADQYARQYKVFLLERLGPDNLVGGRGLVVVGGRRGARRRTGAEGEGHDRDRADDDCLTETAGGSHAEFHPSSRG